LDLVFGLFFSDLLVTLKKTPPNPGKDQSAVFMAASPGVVGALFCDPSLHDF
jgi:hypothetical protein